MKLKQIFLSFFVLCAVVFAFVAAKDNMSPAPIDSYSKEITADTITNTESDTLTFVATFQGAWLPVFKFETTQLSGTQNLSVVFQESHKTSGSTDWMAVGSAVTTSGSTDSDIFRYASATTPVGSGIRYRVIITGTGTQSTRYTGRLVAKRLN